MLALSCAPGESLRSSFASDDDGIFDGVSLLGGVVFGAMDTHLVV